MLSENYLSTMNYIYNNECHGYIIKNYKNNNIDWINIIIGNNINKLVNYPTKYFADNNVNKLAHYPTRYYKIISEISTKIPPTIEKIIKLFMNSGDLSVYYNELNSKLLIKYVNNIQGIKIYFLPRHGSPCLDAFELELDEDE